MQPALHFNTLRLQKFQQHSRPRSHGAGHAEPAAGAIGIFTLCCTAVSRVLYGNGIALRRINQHVAVMLDTRKIFSKTVPSNMFTATRQQTALVAPMTISGVSAFAFQEQMHTYVLAWNQHILKICSSGYLGSRSGTASVIVLVPGLSHLDALWLILSVSSRIFVQQFSNFASQTLNLPQI